MKTILITGASGFLGSNLVTRLVSKGNTRVIAILGRPEDKANLLPKNDLISMYPCSDLLTTDFGHVDTLIHTAFSRGDNLLGLSASIEMTERVIELVNSRDIDSIINISTQGLYQGLRPGEKVTEDGPIGPNTAYGLAKWAVENMFKIGCRKCFTNIRMASLSANARFLDFFVDSVIKSKTITVTAPNQFASIMDVSDAASGIISIVDLPINKRQTVYNLGSGTQLSILEYARMVNEVGELYGYSPVRLEISDSGVSFAICMDCAKLMGQTGWSPKVSLRQMIQHIYDLK